MNNVDNNSYTPLQLEKLCCNIIVKEFYHKNEFIFIEKIKNIGLPDTLNEIILDRYRVIKHILNHS